MTTDCVRFTEHDVCKTGDPRARSPLWTNTRRAKGPILKIVEGEDSAILYNDDESVCTASRENSLNQCDLATQPSFEAVDSHMASHHQVSNGKAETAVGLLPATELKSSPEDDSSSCKQAAVQCEDADLTDSMCEDDFGADDDHFSELGEGLDTEVVYVREGVAVWPTKKQRIMGRLSLIRQQLVMFMAWLPYTQASVESASHTSPTDKSAAQTKDWTMYAIHPIPLSDVKAIRRHTPSFGWQYIVVVLVDGLTLPPLYFGTGGVRALFAALRQHVHLSRSSEDPNTYLVNDMADPLQRSLNCLELTDYLPAHSGAGATWTPPAGSSSAWQDTGEGRAPLVASVLEQFGRMTARARETTSNLLTSTWGVQPDEETLAAAALGVPGCTPSQAEGPPPLLLARQAARGMQPQTSHQERLHSGEHTSTSVGVFELIDKSGAKLPTQQRPGSPAPPVYQEEFASFFDSQGKMVGWKTFKERVFSSGIEPSLRQKAWKYLLGFYTYDSTRADRRSLRRKKKAEYERMKAQWVTLNDEQASRNAKWRERRGRVDKDVRRTDRQQPFYHETRGLALKQLRNILLTYVQYNNDLGYCQGMSDLASPILFIMRDEAKAFWCFTAFMARLEGNFQTDSSAMHAQLLAVRNLVQLLDPAMHSFMEEKSCLNYFFCYRWLLIHFKREFAFDEVLHLWEALWSNPYHDHFHLYICLAVLQHHRRAILSSCQDFDDLLKLCVQLSGRIPLAAAIQDADALCRWGGQPGLDCLADLSPGQV